MHLNKLSIALTLAGPAVSASAGPDWTVIERARDTVQRAHVAATPAPGQVRTDPGSTMPG